MPPHGIDSLDAKSLKGLVLSLLAKISSLSPQAVLPHVLPKQQQFAKGNRTARWVCVRSTPSYGPALALEQSFGCVLEARGR
jgi:hypothetical protein